MIVFLATILLWPISIGAIRQRVQVDQLREQFLQEALTYPRPVQSPRQGVAMPSVNVGMGLLMGFVWVWRLLRSRKAIARHRQRVRQGKARRAARDRG